MQIGIIRGQFDVTFKCDRLESLSATIMITNHCRPTGGGESSSNTCKI